jgi:hypothetical protein
MKEKRNHFLTAIIAILFLVVSCETDNYSTIAPTSNLNEEQQPNEINNEYYNYLWEHEYIYNAKFLLDFNLSKGQFYGFWESETGERFIFGDNKDIFGYFEYFENKNNIEPKYKGKFITYNNYTDLVCDINLSDSAWQMVIFTPFKFENDKLYLGRNKYRLFNKVGENNHVEM